jgi:hypothetical protein
MVNWGAALPMRGGCEPLLQAAKSTRQMMATYEIERFTDV